MACVAHIEYLGTGFDRLPERSSGPPEVTTAGFLSGGSARFGKIAMGGKQNLTELLKLKS
jgi:hypothetical protein